MRALGSRRRAPLRGNTAAAFALGATLGEVVYALDRHPQGRVQEAARLQFRHQLGMGSASVASSGCGSATSRPSRSAMDAGWVCAWEFLRFPHRNRFVQIIHAWPRHLGPRSKRACPAGALRIPTAGPCARLASESERGRSKLAGASRRQRLTSQRPPVWGRSRATAGSCR